MYTFRSFHSGWDTPIHMKLHGFDDGNTVVVRLLNRWVRLEKRPFVERYREVPRAKA